MPIASRSELLRSEKSPLNVYRIGWIQKDGFTIGNDTVGRNNYLQNFLVQLILTKNTPLSKALFSEIVRTVSQEIDVARLPASATFTPLTPDQLKEVETFAETSIPDEIVLDQDEVMGNFMIHALCSISNAQLMAAALEVKDIADRRSLQGHITDGIMPNVNGIIPLIIAAGKGES